MSYVGFLIANSATGFDRSRQPWLLPDDAQAELLDGYVYRGVWQKREGYSQFATGQRGGSAYCESRMVHQVTAAAMTGVINGVNRVFTLAATDPIRRGTFVVSGSNPVQSFTDDGLGRFLDAAVNIQTITNASPASVTTTVNHGYTTGDQVIISGVLGMTEINSLNPYTITVTGLTTFTLDGIDSTDYGVYDSGGTSRKVIGSINYTTGAVSITLPSAPIAASTVTATYDYHPGNPVMGIMTFYRADRERELIVADTEYVNRYNAASNRLEDISTTTYNGTNKSFWSWVNYNNADDDERLLFVNNVDPIQQYNGTTISEYPVYTDSAVISAAAYGVGDGTVGPYLFSTPANTAIAPGNVTVDDTVGGQTITFNQLGVASGDGTGTIDFLAGTVSVTFNVAVGVGDPITIDYTNLNTPIETCLLMFQLKDRLILLRPTIASTSKVYNKRIMISGTGVYTDVFAPNVAIGAGFIDIPDDGYIVSADFNRDELLIMTNQSFWIMKYTGNDVVPFTIDKIDGSRGGDAPFGTNTYLNRTDTASTRGFVVSDGYTVDRRDDKIPDYSYNEIDQQNFDLCFAGNVDIDRDHYLIHPRPGESASSRILVYNYEELNYAVYRIPLSCMGTFIGPFNVTWNDLLIYENWDEMAADYSNWNSFAYSEGSPISLGGGHQGQIFKLNVAESEDYGVKIRNITVLNNTQIQVTTDFQNYEVGDVVSIEAVSGMLRINNRQGSIQTIDTANYTFTLNVGDTAGISGFVANPAGTAYKVIRFESSTKKFNPFSDADKKVKCGWLYMYVNSGNPSNSSIGTKLRTSKNISFVDLTDPCAVTIPGHGYVDNQQIFIQDVTGTTELNGNQYFVTVVTDDVVTLNGIDATGFTPYVSGGFSETPVPGQLQINTIADDNPNITQVAGINPQGTVGNLTNLTTENGTKKWYKIWINQVGRFLQFQVINQQAGANVQIQAMMPGFAPVGRLI